MPNDRTDSWLDFGLAVAQRRLVEQYDEVLTLFTRKVRNIPAIFFPVQAFKLYAARAMILSDRGEPRAAEEAVRALEAASVTDSGLRYHPDIGLVDDKYEDVKARLLRIMGG